MEETKTVEYIIGGLGLLFFIGIGALLGYLWNELRWRTREDKRLMIDMIDSHEKSTKDYMNREEICANDKGVVRTSSSLKNLEQE